MSPHHSPALHHWLPLALVALTLVAGCSSIAVSPETRPTQLAPTAALPQQPHLPAASPTVAALLASEAAESQASAPAASPAPLTAPVASTAGPAGDPELAELEANMSLHTWIAALQSENADLASYVFRLEAGAAPDEFLGHVVALQRFIEGAEDPANTSFGASRGFQEITGNYSDQVTGRRVGVALLQFERGAVCFRADMAYVQRLWSVERWEPIRWAECEVELARLPAWVREEWRAALL